MRIGIIAPPWVTVPPTGYGGTEVVVDNLARGLQELGHEVRLFTLANSTCPVRRSFLYRAPAQNMGTSVEEAAHVLAAYEEFADLDLIHDHTVLGPLLGRYASPRLPPIVCTHHGVFTKDNIAIFTAIARRARVIAISHDQANRAGPVPIAAVIHHGVDTSAYWPGPGDGEYLVFVGRMSPDKGCAAAVRVAHASGLPLHLAAKIREPAEHEYFDSEVRPLLGRDDEFAEELPTQARVEMVGHARALLNPIGWPEPFGLVMAEALACGTPVLTFRCGAAAEIIDDGRTGFLCHDEADMVMAVGRTGELDRAVCRATAEKRFSLRRMAHDHDRLYERILQRAQPGTRSDFRRLPNRRHTRIDISSAGGEL